jgi:hypothetical protein
MGWASRSSFGRRRIRAARRCPVRVPCSGLMQKPFARGTSCQHVESRLTFRLPSVRLSPTAESGASTTARTLPWCVRPSEAYPQFSPHLSTANVGKQRVSTGCREFRFSLFDMGIRKRWQSSRRKRRESVRCGFESHGAHKYRPDSVFGHRLPTVLLLILRMAWPKVRRSKFAVACDHSSSLPGCLDRLGFAIAQCESPAAGDLAARERIAGKCP